MSETFLPEFKAYGNEGDRGPQIAQLAYAAGSTMPPEELRGAEADGAELLGRVCRWLAGRPSARIAAALSRKKASELREVLGNHSALGSGVVGTAARNMVRKLIHVAMEEPSARDPIERIVAEAPVLPPGAAAVEWCPDLVRLELAGRAASRLSAFTERVAPRAEHDWRAKLLADRLAAAAAAAAGELDVGGDGAAPGAGCGPAKCCCQAEASSCLPSYSGLL
mmetsp:Transcript_76175/g.213591  ORF Transcript_76175/g.213591 Transcript_76175/m.213591 type:complete len:223 (-) Transcript_76175:98-766(-)